MINNELRRWTSYTPNMAPWTIDPPKNRVLCNSSICHLSWTRQCDCEITLQKCK